MFLNKSFIKLYEELSELNESKADTQKLVDFAGEELANKFLNAKSKLKAPENDLYYWIKNKTPDELEAYLVQVENTKSNTQIKKEIDKGAELVCDTEHWSVYHITTFEASQKYGRDSKWCITGINDWGDKYWNQYTESGIDFYFLITKGEYDPRGTDSKFAIAINKEQNYCEVFNQQDTQIPLSKIPYIDEVKLPTTNLIDLFNKIVCFECGDIIEEADTYYGPHEECYCKNCFDSIYFRCKECSEFHFAYVASFEDEHGDKFCLDCYDYNRRDKKITAAIADIEGLEGLETFSYEVNAKGPYRHFTGITKSKDDLYRRILSAISNGTVSNKDSTNVRVISLATGEIIYETTGVGPGTTKELADAVEKYLNEHLNVIKDERVIHTGTN